MLPRRPNARIVCARRETKGGPCSWARYHPRVSENGGSAERMRFDDVLGLLEQGLSRPLPGSSAHSLLAPRPQRAAPCEAYCRAPRDGAALLLLYPRADCAHLVLTRRTASLVHHGGQISLPGGTVELGESFEQAAVREAQEEIGLMPEAVRIAGRLTPIEIPISGFRLHPIIGLTGARPELTALPGEVDRILEPSIAALADARNLKLVSRRRDGLEQLCPTIDLDGDEIWGATAMVLAELLTLFGLPPSIAR